MEVKGKTDFVRTTDSIDHVKSDQTHVVLYQKKKHQSEQMKAFTSGYMNNNIDSFILLTTVTHHRHF